jgi:hypothetical protein
LGNGSGMMECYDTQGVPVMDDVNLETITDMLVEVIYKKKDDTNTKNQNSHNI